MKRYMLDTNMVSHLIKSHPLVTQHIIQVPITAICISAITEGELLFGLAKRPESKRLHAAVVEFLRRVDVLPWDSEIARHYGVLRAKLVSKGKTLAPLDLLIASHASCVDAVLVTNDQAFGMIEKLVVADWTVQPL